MASGKGLGVCSSNIETVTCENQPSHGNTRASKMEGGEKTALDSKLHTQCNLLL